MPRETYAKLQEAVEAALKEEGYSERAAQEFWLFYKSDMRRGHIYKNGFRGTILSKQKETLEISDILPNNIHHDGPRDVKICMSLEEVANLLGFGIVNRIRAYQRKLEDSQQKSFETKFKTRNLYERNEKTGKYELEYTGPRLVD